MLILITQTIVTFPDKMVRHLRLISPLHATATAFDTVETLHAIGDVRNAAELTEQGHNKAVLFIQQCSLNASRVLLLAEATTKQIRSSPVTATSNKIGQKKQNTTTTVATSDITTRAPITITARTRPCGAEPPITESRALTRHKRQSNKKKDETTSKKDGAKAMPCTYLTRPARSRAS